MPEGKTRSGDIELWWESFGEAGNPAVLLVMGAMAQAVVWPDYFIEPLVDAGYFVVRFDNRDIGLSTWNDFDASPYTIADMAADAVAVLDGLGIGQAHWIGLSMGGMIAQQAALDFPARVRSLVSFMSTLSSPMDPDLPGMTDEVQAAVNVLLSGNVDPTEANVGLHRVLAGSKYTFNEAAFREQYQKGLDRGGRNPRCGHGRAIEASPSRRERLHAITVPTLVLHGGDDPLVRVAHAHATAEAIPGAKLAVLKGAGHDLPPAAVRYYLDAIRVHLAAAEKG